jgi:polar amino acid transport system substrate-binding protein
MFAVKKALLGAFVCAGLLATGYAYADNAVQRIQAAKVIRVAVPTDYAPYGSVGSDMQPVGIDIDTANLVASKLGVKLQLVPVTAPTRVAYLQTGKADITISSLGKTPEREKVIDYTIAYAPFFDAVYGHTALPVKSFGDMSGKTVSVTRGSMQDQEISTKAPGALIQRFEDNNSTIQAFLSGQTQMMAVGTTVAAAMQKQHPGLDLNLKEVLSNSPCYIGVPKGEQDLVAKLNEIIRQAKADGTINKIAMKWLGTPAGDLPE